MLAKLAGMGIYLIDRAQACATKEQPSKKNSPRKRKCKKRGVKWHICYRELH